ncbi:hypothetical protein N7532_000084 [Penicillium argentinense]|uniref:Kelch repeat protein n=1 Tax=Penicillium argentinense TaxID=1131581 RepID=A0A9W9G4T1_9EURO|nr:uncharacterized protein N7532_000084 [Penicillium argentinense]KAJ5112039.1 hypothetical protein N7532_000084 [Penicillium argentinense]
MTGGIWTKLSSDNEVPRSSQTLAVLGNNAYIYGGELRPREPVDSTVYSIQLSPSNFFQRPWKRHISNPCTASLNKEPSAIAPSLSPQPRVGAASTALNGKIYIFSGRGGTAMAPIEEHGSFWEFTPSTQTWAELKVANPKHPYPTGRSYHALTNNGSETIYLHAGCPTKGRLGDLWSFNIHTRTWKELLPAPAPERGGTSIAYSQGKIFRMNGFDGNKEQGGAIDVFDMATNAWSTISYSPDGVSGPSSRSVSCLLALSIAGRPSLITMFGERDPSSLGHQGAGKMLADVWVFDIGSEVWRKVLVEGERPEGRGWFDAGVVADSEGASVVVHGGLAESNERLGDVWRLDFAI